MEYEYYSVATGETYTYEDAYEFNCDDEGVYEDAYEFDYEDEG